MRYSPVGAGLATSPAESEIYLQNPPPKRTASERETLYSNHQDCFKYRSTDKDSGRERYRTRYEGEIPAELVRRDRNRFILELGKLPIDSRFLQSGISVEIELTLTRSFGGRSAQQDINWQSEIRR